MEYSNYDHTSTRSLGFLATVNATFKRILRDRWRFFKARLKKRENWLFLASLAYVYVAVVGYMHDLLYYRLFGLNIAQYARIDDFAFAVLKNQALLISVVVILCVLFGGGFVWSFALAVHQTLQRFGARYERVELTPSTFEVPVVPEPPSAVTNRSAPWSTTATFVVRSLGVLFHAIAVDAINLALRCTCLAISYVVPCFATGARAVTNVSKHATKAFMAIWLFVVAGIAFLPVRWSVDYTQHTNIQSRPTLVSRVDAIEPAKYSVSGIHIGSTQGYILLWVPGEGIENRKETPQKTALEVLWGFWSRKGWDPWWWLWPSSELRPGDAVLAIPAGNISSLDTYPRDASQGADHVEEPGGLNDDATGEDAIRRLTKAVDDLRSLVIRRGDESTTMIRRFEEKVLADTTTLKKAASTASTTLEFNSNNLNKLTQVAVTAPEKTAEQVVVVLGRDVTELNSTTKILTKNTDVLTETIREAVHQSGTLKKTVGEVTTAVQHNTNEVGQLASSVMDNTRELRNAADEVTTAVQDNTTAIMQAGRDMVAAVEDNTRATVGTTKELVALIRDGHVIRREVIDRSSMRVLSYLLGYPVEGTDPNTAQEALLKEFYSDVTRCGADEGQPGRPQVLLRGFASAQGYRGRPDSDEANCKLANIRMQRALEVLWRAEHQNDALPFSLDESCAGSSHEEAIQVPFEKFDAVLQPWPDYDQMAARRFTAPARRAATTPREVHSLNRGVELVIDELGNCSPGSL